MKIIVDEKLAGREILDVLRGELDFSKTMIRELKALPNGITLNGSHATVRAVLREGDALSVECDEYADSENIEPVDIPLDIIYEDEDIIALNKPPFMPTHPSHNHRDDTLANALRYYFRDVPFVFRSINRLDKNTSGIVLVAKTKIAAKNLSEEMKRGNIKKKYIALVKGKLDRCDARIVWQNENSGTVDLPIRRREESIIFREVCSIDDAGAASAITFFEILSECDTCSKLLVSPKTGRTHQIRVHFSHLGNALIGDDLYGETSNIIERHALHACELEFTHPTKKIPMCIVASIPEDMVNAERAFLQNTCISKEI